MAVATTSQSAAPPNGANPVPDSTPTKVTELVKDSGPKVETTAFPPDVQMSAMRSIPLSLLHPSKTNPRKSFDGPEFDELIASVRAHGVIVPVLVRSTWTKLGGPQEYEIVAGERRYRAATKAGLKDIPAIERALTDLQALELQIVENLQRADVTPLEEAASCVQLLQSMAKADPKASRQALVEQLAQKVGKSTRYIYARMKLDELVPEVKAAVSSGRIPVSHADVIVSHPAEKQKKVMADAFTYGEDDKGNWAPDGRTLTVREFKAKLDRRAEQEKYAAERKAKSKTERAKGKNQHRDTSAAVQAKQAAEAKRRERERNIERASSIAVFQAIAGKVKDISGAVLDLLIDQEFEVGNLGPEEHIARLFGWPAKDDAAYGQVRKLYEANRPKLTAEQKARLYFAMRTCIDLEWGQKRLDETATRLKLDPKKIRAAAVAKLKAEEQKPEVNPPASAKKSAKKGGRK